MFSLGIAQLYNLVSQSFKCMLFSISIIQFISIVLIIVFLFLGFKILETKWSYRISKPYKWEMAVVKGEISNQLKNIEKTYRDKVRFYNFWFQIERLKKDNIPGAFAELGVYKGETAKIIHEMDVSRRLHLFDTFEGFSKEDLKFESSKDEKYSPSNFSDANLISSKKFIKGNSNVFFYQGYFPETTKGLVEEKFALVHLDADLYKPTIAALEYFYPRLSPGGVIIIHDFNHTWDGINKAIDEFLISIPECKMEIADWQGSVMIVKNNLQL